VLNVTPHGNEGSIWAAGAGPAADSNGKYLLSRCEWNVRYDAECQWFPDKWRLRERDHELSTKDGHLAVADYFNMYNTVSESNADQDLGSGGAMVVPTFKDSSGVIHALVVVPERIPISTWRIGRTWKV